MRARGQIGILCKNLCNITRSEEKKKKEKKDEWMIEREKQAENAESKGWP